VAPLVSSPTAIVREPVAPPVVEVLTPRGDETARAPEAPRLDEAPAPRSEEGPRADLRGGGEGARRPGARPNGRPTPRGLADLTPAPERAELPHAAIDRDALDVVRRLRRAGHVAYLVGGCVRDLSLGLSPKDFDVATSARPEEIRAVFRNCRIIGRRFRLAHVFFRGGKIIETATFRANTTAAAAPEGDEESDLLIRHDNVFGTEEEDALRRDFTINGLFYDPQSGRIIDHVGGLDDLRLRRVRMIGNPDIRLREDPVRILRAVRIAAKTKLSIDPELLASMERHRAELSKCAAARLFEERMRLFRGGAGEKSLRLLEETGVLDSVFPLVAAHLAQARAGGATDEAELLFAHIAALDGLAQRGEVSDVVILGAVLHAPVAALVAARKNAEPLAAVEELLERAAELGATRKMTERLRQIILAQRHLERPGGKRRQRRVPPEALMRRAYFAEALDLFEIVARATQHEESLVELSLWRERGPVAPEAGEPEGEEPSPHASTTPTQSSRRRRRRRGGRSESRPSA
jgi:poly(A) polymerase